MQHNHSQPPLPEEIQRKLAQYRTQLLDVGMQEPTARGTTGQHLYFYRPATAQTAFVVNLTGSEEYIEVTYGYASTAFTQMSGNADALTVYGVSDDEITIRESFLICDESEEEEASAKIRQMYHAYLRTEKDDLLNQAKAKRKAFIQQIAVRLKPLGFRKKGNSWTRPLENGFSVHFQAQKSAYADMYYFNIVIGKSSAPISTECYYTRVAPPGMNPMDWQAICPETFAWFLDHTVLPVLERIIRTPLQELGKQPEIWSGCICDHRKCERCWVEKNLWEAKHTGIE